MSFCSNFTGNLPPQCPTPETGSPPIANPFLGASMIAEVSKEDATTVTMGIKIMGAMIHILANEPSAYLTVWREYGGDSVKIGNEIEILDEGNNVFALRVRGLEQASNKFAATGYKIIYDNPDAIPPRYFEYHIDKLCSIFPNELMLPKACTTLHIAPVQIKPLMPTVQPSD